MAFINPVIERKALENLSWSVHGQRKDIINIKRAIGSGEIDKKINATVQIANNALTTADDAQEIANVANTTAESARAIANDNTVKINSLEQEIDGKFDKKNILAVDDPRESSDETVYSTKRVDYMFNSIDPPGLTEYSIDTWNTFEPKTFDISIPYSIKSINYMASPNIVLVDNNTPIDETGNTWRAYGDFYTFNFSFNLNFGNIDISQLKMVINFHQVIMDENGSTEVLLKSTSSYEINESGDQANVVGFFECTKFSQLKASIVFVYPSEVTGAQISFGNCSWTGRFATYILITDYYTRAQVNKLISILQTKLEGELEDAVNQLNSAISSDERRITTLEEDTTVMKSNIVSVTEKTSTIEYNISVIDGRVLTNTSDISTLDSRVSINESNISFLMSKVTANENAIATKANSSDITSLQTTLEEELDSQVDKINSSLASISSSVSINESNISSLDSRVSANESSIASKANSSDVYAKEETYSKDEIDENFAMINEIYDTAIAYDYSNSLRNSSSQKEIINVQGITSGNGISLGPFDVHEVSSDQYKFNITLHGKFTDSNTQEILSAEVLAEITSTLIISDGKNAININAFYGAMDEKGYVPIQFTSSSFSKFINGQMFSMRLSMDNESAKTIDAVVTIDDASWTGTLINNSINSSSKIIDEDFSQTDEFQNYISNKRLSFSKGSIVELGTYSANYYKGGEYTHDITISFQTDAFTIDALNECKFTLYINGTSYDGLYAGHEYDSKYPQLMYFAQSWHIANITIPSDSVNDAWNLSLKLDGPNEASYIDIEPTEYNTTHFSNPYTTTWTGHVKATISIQQLVGSLREVLIEKVNASNVYTKAEINRRMSSLISAQINLASIVHEISFSGYVQTCKLKPISLRFINSISISFEVQLNKVDGIAISDTENLDEIAYIVGELQISSDGEKGYTKGFQTNAKTLIFNFSFNFNSSSSETTEPLFSLNSFKNSSIEITSITLANALIISSE